MVADGAEEYFTSAREAPGVWVGQASQRLGLVGTVQPDDFASVRSVSGNQRRSQRLGPLSVAGFDATFCAPKSVSTSTASAPPTSVLPSARRTTSPSVKPGVRVRSAAGRRGHGGADVIDGDGFVAAAFAHRTSRSAIPTCTHTW